VLKLNELFSVWDTYYNSNSFDLYFVGIKKGGKVEIDTLPKYTTDFVTNTSSNVV
jgi:hypothetical protein